MIPTSYEEWRHCIQVICRVPLTVPYVQERLQALGDPAQHTTAQFLRHYGPEHLQRVQAWFAEAGRRLDSGQSA
jgi:hypothetical protein